MKIIAVGDPHFHTDNVPEVNLFTTKLEELCQKTNPDLIVLLGDILHTHEKIHTIPLNLAYTLVDKLTQIAPVMILVGNHDYISNQQFLTDNHWMNGMKQWNNVEIVDKVICKEYKDARLIFVPYVPPGRFEHALDTLGTDWKNVDGIFAHQEFFGCKMGAIISADGDRWNEEYPFVISGHIHDKQRPQENVYYCGSSMQRAFGESEERCIPILTWKNHNHTIEEVDLGLPKKKIVYTTLDNVEDVKIPTTDDKIKITLTGDYDDFKSFKKTKRYQDMIKTGTKVVFKPKKKETVEEDDKITDASNFEVILQSLVLKDKNRFLYQAYEYVVHNRQIEVEDVKFL